MNRLFAAVVVLACLSSCVTNKKTLMLQKDDVHKNHPIDTVLRSYDRKSYDYRLQPYDIVMVRFESLTPSEFDFLNKQAAPVALANPAMAAFLGEMVNEKGEITYPVIGPVKVSGLTIFETQEKLQQLADQFLESPKVIVRMTNFRITLLGEVAREGQVALSNTRVSMLEAIALGGGLGEFADRSNIKLIRQLDNELDIQYINVLDENFVNSPYFYVHQNDVLVVPPLRQKPFRRYFGPNLGLISSSIAFLLLTYNLFFTQNQNTTP